MLYVGEKKKNSTVFCIIFPNFQLFLFPSLNIWNFVLALFQLCKYKICTIFVQTKSALQRMKYNIYVNKMFNIYVTNLDKIEIDKIS